jgi:hypothetical protein
MLWAPTTAAVAVVMHQFPRVTWVSALPLGVPLSLGALGLAALERGSVGSAIQPGAGAASPRTLWILGVALAAMTLFHYELCGFTLTNAVSVSAVLLVILWFTAFERLPAREAVAIVHEHVNRTFTLSSPEIALFLASGLFGAALGTLGWQEALASVVGQLGPWLATALIVFGVPLVTAAGIHPIVPFSILAGALSPSAVGTSEVGVYTAWIVAFMLSMLVSPVSVLNVTSAASFEMSSWRLGARAHWKYALAVGSLAVLVVRLLG